MLKIVFKYGKINVLFQPSAMKFIFLTYSNVLIGQIFFEIKCQLTDT